MSDMAACRDALVSMVVYGALSDSRPAEEIGSTNLPCPLLRLVPLSVSPRPQYG
jgi:hypothetical protein